MFDTYFIAACIKDRACLYKIDDYIDAWHEGKAGAGMELYEFLGMTLTEYAMWIERPEILYFIIDAHLSGKSIQEVIFDAEHRATNNVQEAIQIHDWLIATHRLAA
ncbi:conserved hypothetical protein [Gammaproteobacteria bacterium]